MINEIVGAVGLEVPEKDSQEVVIWKIHVTGMEELQPQLTQAAKDGVTIIFVSGMDLYGLKNRKMDAMLQNVKQDANVNFTYIARYAYKKEQELSQIIAFTSCFCAYNEKYSTTSTLYLEVNYCNVAWLLCCTKYDPTEVRSIHKRDFINAYNETKGKPALHIIEYRADLVGILMKKYKDYSILNTQMLEDPANFKQNFIYVSPLGLKAMQHYVPPAISKVEKGIKITLKTVMKENTEFNPKIL